MDKLRWPVNADQHAYMAMRQVQNRSTCQYNPNENWMADKLKATDHHWTRQAQWGYRLFDFWCGELGVAIEVDGLEHKPGYDAYRDEYNFRRSAVIVLRVRNRNEEDAERALALLPAFDTWQNRRAELDISVMDKTGWKQRISIDKNRSLLEEYLVKIRNEDG